LRRKFGAREIQLPSGSMPTISLCACCDICRTSVLRYASGIQSFGSMNSSAATRASNAAIKAGSSATAFSVAFLPLPLRSVVYMRQTFGT
jgi:hypothetical protein